MPLADEKYPSDIPPLWKVLRNFALLTVAGLIGAWFLVNCGGKDAPPAPWHPRPSVEVTR